MEVEMPDWEFFTCSVAQSMISEQSPDAILTVRGKLYELLGNCIPPGVILKVHVCCTACDSITLNNFADLIA